MANKKVKPSEDFEFLPKRVQESTKLDLNEKNVLATLCYFRLTYSIYAKEHDGWFYTSQKALEEGTEYSHMQLNRILLKLSIKGLIERKSGTNHRCTHYRLHQKIDELLPQTNDTLAEDIEIDNDTLVAESSNDTLDKIRLDESSEDESSLEEKNVYVAPLGEDATTHNNWSEMIDEWKASIGNARTLEELVESKKTFITNATGMPLEYRDKIEHIRDTYEWRYAALRSKH